MKVYRLLLWWLGLAVLGALCWDWLATDPGELVLRLRGTTVSTSVAFALAAWASLWFALWALWWLLRLPLRAWRRRRRRLGETRLRDGLAALQQGHWARAVQLLEAAAAEGELRVAALLAARRAAEAGEDHAASARLLTQLAALDPAAASLDQAERLLAEGRTETAWTTLQALGERLPPRAARLRIEAAISLGRAHEAQPSLAALRREAALPAAELDALELRLGAAQLREAEAADTLLERWRGLPPRLQESAPVAAAFAERAARLGLERDSGEALVRALRAHWDEALVELYGRLPREADAPRIAVCEAWLGEHPDSPQLLTALGRLCREQQLWGKAEDYLHRALARGGGSEASEQLGHVYTALGDNAQAQAAYANALRLARGERPLALGGRPLREQIADLAVAEQRNEHGLPLLPR